MPVKEAQVGWSIGRRGGLNGESILEVVYDNVPVTLRDVREEPVQELRRREHGREGPWHKTSKRGWVFIGHAIVVVHCGHEVLNVERHYPLGQVGKIQKSIEDQYKSKRVTLCGGSKGCGREATEGVSVEDRKLAVMGMLAAWREASAADDALGLKELLQRDASERRIENGSETWIRRYCCVHNRGIKIVCGEG